MFMLLTPISSLALSTLCRRRFSLAAAFIGEIIDKEEYFRIREDTFVDKFNDLFSISRTVKSRFTTWCSTTVIDCDPRIFFYVKDKL